MNERLKGKVAIVTGASKGIGRALAIGLAREGATAALVYNTDRAGAEAACAEIRDHGGQSAAFRADIRHKQEFESLIDKVVEQFGALHILVNNASHTRFGPVDEVTDEDFDDLVDTSLRGPFFGSIAAARKMRGHGGGSIINISSCATGLMIPLHSAYTMVKGGLEALTRQLAFELAPHVRVNCIAPGATSTDRNRGYDANYDSRWGSVTPAGRVARVEDYVGPCAFLAGDESAFMTGQLLRVDGGWTLKGQSPDMSDYDLSEERKRG